MTLMRRWITLLPLLLLAAACTEAEPNPGTQTPAEAVQTRTHTPGEATDLPSPTGEATASPSATSTRGEPGKVTILAVGDMMLGRTVGERILIEGAEVVFAGVQEFLNGADILAGNLECAITRGGTPEPKTFTFAAPPESARALGLAGFDIAVLGNNHSLDHGQEGLADTLQLLEAEGIATVGVGRGEEAAGPLLLESNGLRLAFLSYVDVAVELGGFDTRAWLATEDRAGIAWAEEEKIAEDVRAVTQLADVVIVFMHNGYEGNDMPVRFQRDVARAAIDAGAVAVIGSHPHNLQHVDEYHGGLIAYSLGNFVFDEYIKPENRSAILRLVVDEYGMISYDWFPVVIQEGLPQAASPEQAEEILRRLAP